MVPILHTPRLTLRPWVLEDAPRFATLSNHSSVADQTLTFPFPQPEGWAQTRIRLSNEAAEHGELLPWAIALSSGELVGGIGLSLEAKHRKAELGYWLGTDFWGRGFTTEAATAVIGYAFRQTDLFRVQATVLPDNAASIRVLEKVGMRREGVLRSYVFKNQKPMDLISFSILQTDT